MTTPARQTPAPHLSTRILSLATSAPAVSVSQQQATALALALRPVTGDAARILSAAYGRSGIERRGVAFLHGAGDSAADVLSGQSLYSRPPEDSEPGSHRGPTTGRRLDAYRRLAPAMAIIAARAALHRAETPAAEVGQLVTVSCTGFGAPGVDVAIIEALGLGRDTARTHLGFMGCHGAINALRVADALCAAQPGVPTLLVAVELCTLHFHFSDEPQKLIANALFADGAGAAVLRTEFAEAGLVASATPTAQTHLAATGTWLVPETADAMTWHIGDHGFEMTLSPRVPELIEAELPGRLAAFLSLHGLSQSQISGWAVHPGGPRVLDAVERGLRLPPEALGPSRRVLAEHGNMSSPTVLFILRRLLEQGVRGPVVMLAFGPGLTIEVAVVRCGDGPAGA